MIALTMLAALLVYLAVAWLVVKRLKNKKAKWIAIAVLVLIPTWDEIIGRSYFHYLCASEGGIKVFKTVELPSEYWDQQGKPRFIRPDGLVDKEMLKARVEIARFYEDERHSLFRIRKTAEIISDRQGNQIVGAYTYFIYFGGWVVNNAGMHVTGSDCPKIQEASFGKLAREVFLSKDKHISAGE